MLVLNSNLNYDLSTIIHFILDLDLFSSFLIGSTSYNNSSFKIGLSLTSFWIFDFQKINLPN